MARMKRLSRKEFHDIVTQTVNSLPDEAKKYLQNVVVDIEDEPDEELLLDLGYTEEEIADGASLFGLYNRMPDFAGDVNGPRRIIIYKRPLEEGFPNRDELIEEIRKTVLHELHHHFGYTERDISTWTDLE
jgi:predicted Zn-dependent protease with MMP-like domain